MSNIERCAICEQPVTEGVIEPAWTTGGMICLMCAHSLAVAALKSAREQLQGAVCLTDTERRRLIGLLSLPVPPGPLKKLDEAILAKLGGGKP